MAILFIRRSFHLAPKSHAAIAADEIRLSSSQHGVHYRVAMPLRDRLLVASEAIGARGRNWPHLQSSNSNLELHGFADSGIFATVHR